MQKIKEQEILREVGRSRLLHEDGKMNCQLCIDTFDTDDPFKVGLLYIHGVSLYNH